MIDPELRDIITPELAEGEALLWAGRPQKRPSNLLATGFFLFALAWLSGILTWIYHALTHETAYFLKFPQNIFSLFIIGVFLLIGGQILKHAFIAMKRPARQIYGLTQNRGIILENLGKGDVRSLGKSELGSFLRKGNIEIGTLEFHSPELKSNKINLHMYDMTGIAFHNVANPKAVENIIFNNILKDRP